MIGALGELFRHEGSGVRRAAIVSDVRGGDYFAGPGRGARASSRRAGSTRRSCSWRPTRRRCSTASRRPAAAIRWRPTAACTDGHPRRARGARPLRERADLVMDTSGPHRRDAAPPDLDRAARAEGRPEAGADDPHLRVQERPPARRRPHAGRSLPAEPALPRGPSPADRPRPEVVEYVEAGELASEFYQRAAAAARLPAARLRGRGQDPPDDRDRLYRGPPPLADHRRPHRRAPRPATTSRCESSTGTSSSTRRPSP